MINFSAFSLISWCPWKQVSSSLDKLMATGCYHHSFAHTHLATVGPTLKVMVFFEHAVTPVKYGKKTRPSNAKSTSNPSRIWYPRHPPSLGCVWHGGLETGNFWRILVFSRRFSEMPIEAWWPIITHMGLSENRVYSQWNSHLIGIMISKTIGFRGLAYFQTHPYQLGSPLLLLASISMIFITASRRDVFLKGGLPSGKLT